MNKKAIITYFVLLGFVIIMYFYISANNLGNIKTTSSTTTSSNALNSTSNQSAGSGGLIVNTATTTTGSTPAPVDINFNNSQPIPVYPVDVVSPGNNYGTINNSINGRLVSSCIPYGGFSCSQPVLSSISGNLTLSFSETQYALWSTAEIYILNLTAQPILKNNLINGIKGVQISNISNSEQITLTLPAITPNLPKGVQIQGNIWAVFHLKNSNSTYISEIAQISAQSI